MEEEKKEIEVVNKNEIEKTVSPAEVAVQLLAKGVKPEDLEKMLALQERYEANQARKAYYEAMARVQQDIPIVTRTQKNTQTGSLYANLTDVVRDCKPIYTKEGFSLSFYEGETDKPEHIRVMVDVKHKQGHMETKHYDMPLDGKGIKGNVNMTAIHAKGSSVSYGRRYLTCMVFHVPTGDDDDGNAASGKVEYINEDQLSKIRDYVDNNEGFEKRLLNYLEIESVEKMLKKDYDKAIKTMEAKK